MPDLFGLRPASNEKPPQFQRKTAFKVFSTVNQTFTNPFGPADVVNFDTVMYDLGFNFDLVANRYTVPYQGLYQYNATFVVMAPLDVAEKGVAFGLFSQFGQQILGQSEHYKDFQTNDEHTMQMSGSHVFLKGDQLEIRATGNSAIFLGQATGVYYYWAMYRVESESRTVL